MFGSLRPFVMCLSGDDCLGYKDKNADCHISRKGAFSSNIHKRGVFALEPNKGAGETSNIRALHPPFYPTLPPKKGKSNTLKVTKNDTMEQKVTNLWICG